MKDRLINTIPFPVLGLIVWMIPKRLVTKDS